MNLFSGARKSDFVTKIFPKKPSNTSKPSKQIKAPKTLKITKKPQPSNPSKNSSMKLALKGGVGYKKFDNDALWLPNTTRPGWLNGTLPGDRGFDPLGLAKPVEYLQIELDQLDQNAAQNKPGKIAGIFKPKVDVLTSQSLQPYTEVFGLQRLRECELIHGRWAMLATLGVIIAESATGVSWATAGKVELDGSRYLNFSLPFTISQLCIIEALLVGAAELYRNGELDSERRTYPGGYFDPLGLATSGRADA